MKVCSMILLCIGEYFDDVRQENYLDDEHDIELYSVCIKRDIVPVTPQI